jgi:hypothetical protein
MKRLLVVLMAGACSSPTATAPERELPAMVGQPVDLAVQKLGPFTSMETVSGLRVYVWTFSGQNGAFFPAAAFGGPSAMATVPTVRASCSLRMTVDAGGVIQRGEYRGSAEVCSPYVGRLQ